VQTDSSSALPTAFGFSQIAPFATLTHIPQRTVAHEFELNVLQAAALNKLLNDHGIRFELTSEAQKNVKEGRKPQATP
jgi:hypothetical protein